MTEALVKPETQWIDPLQDGKSRIELVSWMGGDLDVVNDAKASFARISTELGEKEEKLINYLIQHRHTSPFRGVVFKVKVKAPLFIARQWWKHVIASAHNDEQLQWNEMSLRYVEVAEDADYYVPNVFRLQSKSNKQGSAGSLPQDENSDAQALYEATVLNAIEAYKEMIDMGVCREQARGVLPSTLYTSWVWTASLQSVLHFLDLRQGHGAQSEIKAYADAISELVSPVVPKTIEAWKIAGII